MAEETGFLAGTTNAGSALLGLRWTECYRDNKTIVVLCQEFCYDLTLKKVGEKIVGTKTLRALFKITTKLVCTPVICSHDDVSWSQGQ